MFARVLVPLDHSRLAEQAIARAAAIACTCHGHMDLVLVHGADPFVLLGDEPFVMETLLREEEAYVVDLARDVTTRLEVPATGTVVRGDVVSGIVAHAREIGADLIVMTSHGRTGLNRSWLGSVADGVIRAAGIPVLMLRPSRTTTPRPMLAKPFRSVMVPLDGSATSMRVLDAASALAQASGARMMLLRVVQPIPLITAETPAALLSTLGADPARTDRVVSEARKELADISKSLSAQGVVSVSAEVVVAERVAQAIIDYARTHGAHLIAMATHGRGASRLVVGSVADKVLRSSGTAMLLLRPTEVERSDVAASVASATLRPV
jgi:nucleotide-binding universal stress UspA family protein